MADQIKMSLSFAEKVNVKLPKKGRGKDLEQEQTQERAPSAHELGIMVGTVKAALRSVYGAYVETMARDSKEGPIREFRISVADGRFHKVRAALSEARKEPLDITKGGKEISWPQYLGSRKL